VGVQGLLDIMQPGIRAVQRNWAPFLLIQAAAAVLVSCYYHFELVRAAAQAVSNVKHEFGELFVIASGAIAGGVVPQIAKIATKQTKRIDRSFWKDTLYTGFVFAVLAMMVDAFYKVQTLLFGTGIDLGTLIKKTSVDMFVVSPALFVPTGMFLFYARQNKFKTNRIGRAFSWSFYRAYAIPTLPLNVAFWTPMVMCVYALPSALQFPFAQLAEGAWSLIFVFIAADAGGAF